MIDVKSGVCFLETATDNHFCGYTTKHFPVFFSGASVLTNKNIQEQFKSSVNPFIKNKLGGREFHCFAFLNQVHGNNVAVFDESVVPDKNGFNYFLEADAIISNKKDSLIMAMTADCLSVFFFAGDWIGIAHAGWRGTQLGISEKTLNVLCQRSGLLPSQVKICFGSCIRKAYYEVGAEFSEYFPDSTEYKSGHYYFDIAAENKKRLLNSGARESFIFDQELCTNQTNEDFYSFRLEKQSAGRMVSFSGFNK